MPGPMLLNSVISENVYTAIRPSVGQPNRDFHVPLPVYPNVSRIHPPKIWSEKYILLVLFSVISF